MDFDDIFEQKHRSRNQHYDHNYRHEDEDEHGHQNSYRHENEHRHENEQRSSHSYDKQNDLKLMLLDKLRDNPKLKMLLIT